MPDKWDERKAALLREANAAFAKPNTEQAKTAGTPPQTEGRGSEMVRTSAPTPAGPKPPGIERVVLARQKHQSDLENEKKGVEQANLKASGKSPKPVIELTEEQKKQAGIIREKFRQAAERERERER